jgi:uncharacterized protein (TIGR03435 family)
MFLKILASSLLLSTLGIAQSPGLPALKPPPPKDVVASVKPIPPNSNPPFNFRPLGGGGFDAFGAPLPVLIQIAFRASAYQVEGIPGWAMAARYGIRATVANATRDFPGGAAPSYATSALTMRTILVKRFGLRFHWAVVPGRTYDLLVYQNKPKLTLSPASELRAVRPNTQPMVRQRPGMIAGTTLTMGNLATLLGSALETTVADKTELSGRYDVTLKWEPDVTAVEEAGTPSALPGLFTALKEQLGLELKPVRGQVRRLVIDSIHPPTPD